MSILPNIEMVQLKLVKCIFAVNAEHRQADDRIAIGVSLKNNGEFFENGRLAHFSQHFKTADPLGTPFFLEVEFEARFFLDPAPLPLERPHCVRRIFPQIVFPYMREYVAEITRRGGFTPLLLNHNIFDDEKGTDSFPDDEEHKWIH